MPIYQSNLFFLALALLPALLPTVAIPQASATTCYGLGYAGGRNGDGVLYAYGIDVSEHQGTGFNFQNLKNNGYSYVILRCGFVTRKDYRFEEYYANAKAAGLDVGAYFYSYATIADEAAYEAERCLSYISGKTFEYPIYFDFEDSSAYSGSSTTAYNLCTAFLDKVAAAGYLVGLYGYAGWFDESYAVPGFLSPPSARSMSAGSPTTTIPTVLRKTAIIPRAMVCISTPLPTTLAALALWTPTDAIRTIRPS